ncbi:hypothetical protein DBV05_g7982 [Lasiodiplodia theobromae]|uniref:Uncharacterized protein n=2 Tax=Lasiodiplodia theobromae TaxID=45133 RepID=A0A5N5D7N9_9PEZI|nr:hypothetical protein DBV05_g7982 [Lasiodiplodia theobromae]
MAMDPFTQQLLSYPTRNVYAEGATFPAADRYDANNYKGGLEDTDLLLDQGVQGAVLSGIFNLDFPVQLGCVSGTCTWPRFVTLGVTSSCKNVTNGTKVSGYDNIYDYTSPSGIHMTTTFLHNSSSQIDHLRNLSSPTDSIMKVAIANIKSPFSRSHPDVSECEVKWCAKIFNNVTVTNGTLSAGHVREIPLRFAELNTTDEKHPVVRFKAITDELQLASRTFEINTTDWLLTVAFLASLFSSIATDNINSNVQTVIDVSPNVAEMLANISTSMTYAIGNNPSGSKVAGKVIIQEQFIRVSWYWIILPVAEILMGLAFLGATILYTQRKGVTIWKSSPVFPFFTRLEGWEDSSLSVASLKEIETRSGKMWGILRPGDGGTVSFSRSDV